MLGALLTPSSNVCLDNVATVQERHLSVLLDPDLVSGVGCDDIEGSNVQSELSSLGEFAQAGTEGEKRVARDGSGEVGKRFTNVVDS